MSPTPIRQHTGPAVPLRRRDVDTDQIIPAEFCKRLGRTGYDDALFHRWRKEEGFVLNNPTYSGASVLVSGPDFGIGSSREHAVWALADYGFHVVIAPTFGDIFRANAAKNQLLAPRVSQEAVEWLWQLIETSPSTPITTDLQRRIIAAEGTEIPFEIDDHSRWQLLNGLDDIQVTLRRTGSIEAHERTRPPWFPSVPRAGHR